MRCGALLALMLVPAAAAAGTDGDICFERAQTQVELDRCADADYQAADAELNRVYQQVRQRHAGDETFLRRLQAAQKAWLSYRDAELAARYPEPPRSYGSAFPLCRAALLAELTRERTARLQRWLAPGDETDACAGSLSAP